MPLTKDGTIVVNNLLASTYVSIQEQAPGIVQAFSSVFSEDQLLHWWLAPYRMVCLGISSSLCRDDKDDREGIAYYLLLGRYVAQLGETFQSSWLQTTCVAIVAMAMAILMMVEATLLTPLGSLTVVLLGIGLWFAFAKRSNNLRGKATSAKLE